MNELETFLKTIETLRKNPAISEAAEEMDFSPTIPESPQVGPEDDSDAQAEIGLQHKDKILNKFKDLVDEYISEAEHQDGYSYWNNFKDEKEFVEDLAIYISNRIDPPADKGPPAEPTEEMVPPAASAPVRESFESPMDIEDMERDEVGGGSLPIEFSETIRNMTVGELLQQIKGTSEDLYSNLTNFLKDVYHEQQPGCGQDEEESPCPCGDGTSADLGGMTSDTAMAAIPNVIKQVLGGGLGHMRGQGPMIKRVMIAHGESNQKTPDADLLVEAFKVKRQMKQKKTSKKCHKK